ncbi:MAG TPA: T9SS type A sorting domain-containing protein [Bacteroidales bacterium]|nr:T9SS type A sorting domain-containing protein [Bacteroidales bacterium]
MKNLGKNLIMFIVGVCSVASLHSQTYLISQSGTISTCSGTLYDSGGATGSYGNGESYTITICSSMAGGSVKLLFSAFDLEHGYDLLSIYNGPNVNSPALVVEATGNSLLGTEIVGTTCLTLKFTSDPSVTQSGWAAVISCLLPPQHHTLTLITNPIMVQAEANYINCCPGQTVTFHAINNFFENDQQGYFQSIENTTYLWTISVPGQPNIPFEIMGNNEFIYTFATPGVYSVKLSCTDSLGVESMNSVLVYIRVANPPDFAGSYVYPQHVCPGNMVELHGAVEAVPLSDTAPGQPVNSFQTSFGCIEDQSSDEPQFFYFDVQGYAEDAVISDTSSLTSVCLNIEHSFVGDMYIYIVCPTGQEASISSYYTCNGSYFGLPDHNDDCIPGTGYEYCWTMSADQHITEVCESGQTIPAGCYLPQESYNQLVGCPINGTWSLKIIENWGIDDGYLFDARIQFSDFQEFPAPYGDSLNNFVIGNDVNSLVWTGNNVIDAFGTEGYAIPLVENQAIEYTFTVSDDFGCVFDTVLVVNTGSLSSDTCCLWPHTTICEDQIICGLCTSISARIPESGNTGAWVMVSGPGDTSFDAVNSNVTGVCVTIPGTYQFRWTEYYQGNVLCTDDATVNIQFTIPVISYSPSAYISECSSIQLHVETGPFQYSYHWYPEESLNDPYSPEPWASPDTTTKYTLTINDLDNDCSDMIQITVHVTPAQAPQICAVDYGETLYPYIVWTNTTANQLDSVFIYREATPGGEYIKIGSAGTNSFNQFVDISLPDDAPALRYKITGLSLCGNETGFSDPHRPFLLHFDSIGDNTYYLHWENYEGISFSEIEIYRGSSSQAMELITIVPADYTEYYDYSAPASGFVYYQLRIHNPVQCNPAKSENYIYSNVATNDDGYYLGSHAPIIQTQFSLSPNPARNTVNISFDSPNAKLSICDLNGKKLIVKNDFTGGEINIEHLKAGVYVVKLETEGSIGVRKLVVE